MRIENDFIVDAPPERVWDVLTDMPVVVACMPGAELTETIDENHWKTTLTVKVGPISLTFAAELEREVADWGSGRIVMTSKARETKGRGGATARVESLLESIDAGSNVSIVTNVTLSGTAAQFGRPVVTEVSRQLVATFAACLQSRVEPVAPPAGGEDSPTTLQAAEPPPAVTQPISGSFLLRALIDPLLRLVRRGR
jgi:carbon monoxide dehydrogenase subunit G